MVIGNSRTKSGRKVADWSRPLNYKNEITSWQVEVFVKIRESADRN